MRQRNIQLLSVFQYELSPVQYSLVDEFGHLLGGGPRVVVSTAAFHARAQGSFLGLGGLKETNMFLPHRLVKLSIVGSLCDREVACSASDLLGSNPVSGGQCYLTHLFILRRFSWPNLDCMCTKVHLDLLKGDKSVLMKRLESDSETVPKPNVLLVDHMYGECQEQWQTLRTVARYASQVVKSTKVQLSLSSLLNRHMKD